MATSFEVSSFTMRPGWGRGRGRGRGRGGCLGHSLSQNPVDKSEIQHSVEDDVDGTPLLPLRSYRQYADRYNCEDLLVAEDPVRSHQLPITFGTKEHFDTLRKVETCAKSVVILHVDTESKVVYVMFGEEMEEDVRTRFKKIIHNFSDQAVDLCIPVKNAQDVGEVLAFIDIGVSYHAKSKCRSQSLSEWNENNLEAETQREKLVIVKNDRNLCQKIAASEKTFFHAIKCTVELAVTNEFETWKQENDFIMQDSQLVEDSLLSALDLYAGQSAVVTMPNNTAKLNKPLALGIDLCQTATLREYFIKSLVFFSIPRLPPVKQKKLGVITNVRGDGLLDIVFLGNQTIWSGLWKALHEVQKTAQLTGPCCQLRANKLAAMIASFSCRQFLAPYSSDWSVLHRVKVVGAEFGLNAKVVYLDSGKQATIPVRNLAFPRSTSHDAIPELLYLIPPQAILVRAKLDVSDYEQFRTLSNGLEGKPCIIKTVAASSLPFPIVEVYTVTEDKQLMSVTGKEVPETEQPSTDIQLLLDLGKKLKDLNLQRITIETPDDKNVIIQCCRCDDCAE